MNKKELTELIIKEVMRRLSKSEKKALVLFTGGTAGFEEGFRQVKELRESGWNITILFTAGAEKIYGCDYLQSKFEVFDLYFESKFSTSHDFLKDINLMLIPILTMNTAVKIALGIADTPATHLVSRALINGIPIVAAKDACNSRDHKADTGGFGKGAEVYRKKLDSYVQTLEEYGVKLVPCKNICESVASIENKDQSHHDGMKKRIITKEDILKAREDGTMKIIVGSNTKVTSYAEEIAGEIGVEILCI